MLFIIFISQMPTYKKTHNTRSISGELTQEVVMLEDLQAGDCIQEEVIAQPEQLSKAQLRLRLAQQ